ncbi:MAG: DsbE family thiol:disulfide interchange protein [Alphaproteobacteria bacterium]
MKQAPYLVPVALFAALVAIFAIQLAGPPPSQLTSPLIGKPVPQFSLDPLSEFGGFTPADLAAGRVTVVNFWASWCAPCRIEHPLLMALARRDDVAVYGIAWKDKPERAQAFLEELGSPFARVVLDQRGRAGIDWGISGVPETFVVDGRGVVRAHVSGPLTPQAVREIVMPAVRGTAPPR